MKTNNKSGFTVFFALLVGSLALTVGAAIFDLVSRELNLSLVGAQSQYAIYAADTGAECALYWDTKCAADSCRSGSAFATSTSYAGASADSGLKCLSVDITSSAAAWSVTQSATAATTVFNIQFSPQVYCATVTVAKVVVSGAQYTTITSRGHNTCAAGAPFQLERAFQLSY